MIRYELASDSVSVFTGAVALGNIENILSIIILILSIANILFNFCIRIWQKMKDKDITSISDDIEETKNELENLKQKEGMKK